MTESGEEAKVSRTRSGKSRKTEGRVRVKWTEEMERSILEYGREGMKNGNSFEKPSVTEYYRKFLEKSLGFGGLPLDKLVQHMRNLKRSYTYALEWRGKTGQGILEADPVSGETTVESQLLKKCKYFHELDEILKDKPQYNPPFIIHASEYGEVENEEQLGTENEIPIFDENDVQEIQNNLNESLEESDQRENQNSSVPKLSPVHIPVKKCRHSPIKSAAAALQSAMKSKVLIDEKRLDWEKTCAEDEKMEAAKRNKDEFDFKMEQLQFERQKWMDEFSHKKTCEEQKLELEKFKVEKEAEIARFKAEKEFELEKLKLGLN